jgi:hypothetical protein
MNDREKEGGNLMSDPVRDLSCEDEAKKVCFQLLNTCIIPRMLGKKQFLYEGTKLFSEALQRREAKGYECGRMEGQVEAGLNAFPVVLEEKEKALKKGWNEGVEACFMIAENIVIEKVGDSAHTACQISTELRKLLKKEGEV